MKAEEILDKAEMCRAFLYSQGYLTKRERDMVDYRIQRHRGKLEKLKHA